MATTLEARVQRLEARMRALESRQDRIEEDQAAIITTVTETAQTVYWLARAATAIADHPGVQLPPLQ
jgi:hypothetical protein